MAGRTDCCRYEATLDELIDDEVMAPVLRSAGLDPQRFRDLIVETARRFDAPASAARRHCPRPAERSPRKGLKRRNAWRKLNPDPEPGGGRRSQPGDRPGPTRDIVGQRDGAAMPPRHRAHEAETEPIARRAAARLEPHEAIEYALAIGLGDARSAIGDLDHRAPAAPFDADRDLAAFRRHISARCRAGSRPLATADGGRPRSSAGTRRSNRSTSPSPRRAARTARPRRRRSRPGRAARRAARRRRPRPRRCAAAR